ncbi:MAG: type IV secretory system conjugative DNA transfer family protein [Acetobacteraceae bacterium]
MADWLDKAAGQVRPVADGLILGRYPGGGLATYGGDAHLLTVAPTGTGKTSGPVITNALNHPGQLIVMDVKGEVYRHTAARRRAMGQEVYVLDLRDNGDPDGCLNPLDLARRCGSEPAVIARAFAAEMIERSGHERERFWNDQAESLLTGVFAWLIDDCEPSDCRISKGFDLLHAGDVPYDIAMLLDTMQVKNKAAYAAFAAFLANSERETRPSILATAVQHIRLFDSELIRHRTDRTSIDIDGLIEGKPMSLYVIVPPARLRAYRSILRLWMSGILMALTQRQEPPEHRTLMLIDECGQLGALDTFLTAATLMRGWGVTLWTFWQSVAQLSVYGVNARALVDQAGVIQLFGSRNFRLARDFTKLIGGITPEEVMRMRPEEMLVMVEGGLPQFIQQARWYSDGAFR